MGMQQAWDKSSNLGEVTRTEIFPRKKNNDNKINAQQVGND